ncbi:hypothetical protein QIP01_gp1, partial [ssRNA phage Zoerhiza.2_1]
PRGGHPAQCNTLFTYVYKDGAPAYDGIGASDCEVLVSVPEARAPPLVCVGEEVPE